MGVPLIDVLPRRRREVDVHHVEHPAGDNGRPCDQQLSTLSNLKSKRLSIYQDVQHDTVLSLLFWPPMRHM